MTTKFDAQRLALDWRAGRVSAPVEDLLQTAYSAGLAAASTGGEGGAKPCRRCSECSGAEHHWIDGAAFGCKHCAATAAQCEGCDEVATTRSFDGAALCADCRERECEGEVQMTRAEAIPAVRMCMICQSREKVDPTARWADNDHPPGPCFRGCGRTTGMLVVAWAAPPSTAPLAPRLFPPGTPTMMACSKCTAWASCAGVPGVCLKCSDEAKAAAPSPETGAGETKRGPCGCAESYPQLQPGIVNHAPDCSLRQHVHVWSRYTDELVVCSVAGSDCENDPVAFCEETGIDGGTCLEGRCREHLYAVPPSTGEAVSGAVFEIPTPENCPACAKVRRKALDGERLACGFHPSVPAPAPPREGGGTASEKAVAAIRWRSEREYAGFYHRQGADIDALLSFIEAADAEVAALKAQLESVTRERDDRLTPEQFNTDVASLTEALLDERDAARRELEAERAARVEDRERVMLRIKALTPLHTVHNDTEFGKGYRAAVEEVGRHVDAALNAARYPDPITKPARPDVIAALAETAPAGVK